MEVGTLTYRLGNGTNLTFSYTYDAAGNIETYAAPGKSTVTYTYDGQNQLTNASGLNSYTYDALGNLTNAGSATYTYGNSSWPDLLTAYKGGYIAYEGQTVSGSTVSGTPTSGNPISYYNGTRWTMEWQEGRNLTKATKSGTEINYTYDHNGLRTSKNVGGTVHTYYYASGKLLREQFGEHTLDFLYDANGAPFALRYNGSTFYYITNLQGDVIRIINSAGTSYADYEYWPWGAVKSATGILATINPLRYRGYYYDTDSGFYYLNSRYYDSETGRFLNADSYASTGQGILGHNMFAYCLNNPVNYEDPNGELALGVILSKAAIVVGKAAVGAAVNVATTFIAAKVTGQSYSWQDAGIAALSGALGTGSTIMKVAAGAVSGIYSGYMAHENGASTMEVIMSSVAAAYGTTVSVANIAGWSGINLSLGTSVFTDLVFGTAANSISAAVYKTSILPQKNINTSDTKLIN